MPAFNDVYSLGTELGKRLRSLRIDNVYTLRYVGEQIGVSPQTVSQWELGNRMPSIDRLFELSKLFSTTSDYLLGLSNDQVEGQVERNGLRWRTAVVSNSGDHAYSRIDFGKRLFERQVVEGATLEQIIRDSNFEFGFESLRRMAKMAFHCGAVELLEVEIDEKICRQLREKYPKIRRCIIPKAELPENDRLSDAVFRPEIVASLGAKMIARDLKPGRKVGVSGGTTLARVADLLPHSSDNLTGVRWRSLISTMRAPFAIAASANDVVARIQYNQPGAEGVRLPFVYYEFRAPKNVRNAPKYLHDELNYAHQMLGQAMDVQDILISLGSSEFNYRSSDYYMGYPRLGKLLNELDETERNRLVGDILLYPIDEDGNRLGDPAFQRANDELIYSIGLERLREVTRDENVWAIVARSSKARVTQAALRGGYVNCLIADRSVAEAMLALE